MLLTFEAVNRHSQRVYTDTFELDSNDFREVLLTVQYVLTVRSLERTDRINRLHELMSSERAPTKAETDEYEMLREQIAQAETYGGDMVRCYLIRGNKKDCLLTLPNGTADILTMSNADIADKLIDAMPPNVNLHFEASQDAERYKARQWPVASDLASIRAAKVQAAKVESEPVKTEVIGVVVPADTESLADLLVSKTVEAPKAPAKAEIAKDEKKPANGLKIVNKTKRG